MSLLPTFFRRVPKGIFTATSSLESSLDGVATASAVVTGAAASGVLAYFEARSSMSFVCHSKIPSFTFFFGGLTASLPATAEKPAMARFAHMIVIREP